MTIIDVVAGIIQRDDGKILLARRKPGSHLAGYWEFPGGKIEDGESPEECLERELQEELGIITKTGKFLLESIFDYGDKKIRLLAFHSKYISGEFILDSHDKTSWTLPKDAYKFELAPADIPIIEFLINDYNI
jgi:mutator protein MutT